MVWIRICLIHGEVNIKRLLVSSDEAVLGDLFIAQLSATQFGVIPIRPGAVSLWRRPVASARRSRPSIFPQIVTTPC
jgi:hypothetical protein